MIEAHDTRTDKKVTKRAKRTDARSSVVRAAKILETLSLNYKKISDISRQSKLSNSTVHRLLQILKDIGLVAQDPSNREYYLGNALFKLNSNLLAAHNRLICCAYDKMLYLRESTGETVALNLKYGIERIRLQQLTGTKNITFLGRATMADPIWMGAVGKVLLAQIPEDEVKVILDNVRLVPLTPYTITDRQAFEKELAKVRQQEYATSFNETDIGVAAIAVPVSNYNLPVSLSIAGPSERVGLQVINYLNELKIKAAEIARDLLK